MSALGRHQVRDVGSSGSSAAKQVVSKPSKQIRKTIPPGASPISGKPPPEEHRWKPGQSGNPGGRPKGESLTAGLRRRLEQQYRGKTLAEALIDALIKGAVQGKPQHLKEVLDRVEGKVTDKLDLNAQGPLSIRVVYDDERPADR